MTASYNISVRLTPAMKQRLHDAAKKIGCGTNMSDCVRFALRDWLDKHETKKGRKE